MKQRLEAKPAEALGHNGGKRSETGKHEGANGGGKPDLPFEQPHFHGLHFKAHVLNILLEFRAHVLKIAPGGKILAAGLIVSVQRLLQGGGLRLRLLAQGVGLSFGLPAAFSFSK